MRLLRLAPIVLGAIAPVALAAGLAPPIHAQTAVAGFALFYIFLTLGPWLSLRTGWSWWAASAAGAVVGLPIAVAFAFGTMPCNGANSGTGCDPSNGLQLRAATVFAIGLGCLAGAQTMVLRTARGRVIWAIAGFCGGALLGLTDVLIDGGGARAYVGIGIGGALWGVVTTAALFMVHRVPVDGRVAAETPSLG